MERSLQSPRAADSGCETGASSSSWTTANRRDKTGSRTFPGVPAGGRLQTKFELQTYLTSWQKTNPGPAYGPLFQSALGGAPAQYLGGTVASATDGANIGIQRTARPGQGPGDSIGERDPLRGGDREPNERGTERAILDGSRGRRRDCRPQLLTRRHRACPRVSIFDYWTPATAVQRVLRGAAVDQMEISVNGDYHEFKFSGLAQDVIDSSSFSSGVASLQSFPSEPATGAFDYSIVPGNLGQAWLGTTAAAVLHGHRGRRSA